MYMYMYLHVGMFCILESTRVLAIMKFYKNINFWLEIQKSKAHTVDAGF